MQRSGPSTNEAGAQRAPARRAGRGRGREGVRDRAAGRDDEGFEAPLAATATSTPDPDRDRDLTATPTSTSTATATSTATVARSSSVRCAPAASRTG